MPSVVYTTKLKKIIEDFLYEGTFLHKMMLKSFYWLVQM